LPQAININLSFHYTPFARWGTKSQKQGLLQHRFPLGIWRFYDFPSLFCLSFVDFTIARGLIVAMPSAYASTRPAQSLQCHLIYVRGIWGLVFVTTNQKSGFTNQT